jgi:hypothetical protein
MEDEAYVYLVIADTGHIFGAYFDDIRAGHTADSIEGVVVKVAITYDYRRNKASDAT